MIFFGKDTIEWWQDTGGANFLLVDGSVKFVSNSVAAVPYTAAGTKSGGEADSIN